MHENISARVRSRYVLYAVYPCGMTVLYCMLFNPGFCGSCQAFGVTRLVMVQRPGVCMFVAIYFAALLALNGSVERL